MKYNLIYNTQETQHSSLKASQLSQINENDTLSG